MVVVVLVVHGRRRVGSASRAGGGGVPLEDDNGEEEEDGGTGSVVADGEDARSPTTTAARAGFADGGGGEGNDGSEAGDGLEARTPSSSFLSISLSPRRRNDIFGLFSFFVFVFRKPISRQYLFCPRYLLSHHPFTHPPKIKVVLSGSPFKEQAVSFGKNVIPTGPSSSLKGPSNTPS